MQIRWREETGGMLAAQVGNLNLQVHRLPNRHYARFAIRRHCTSGAKDVLIGSGTFENARQAMLAAGNMAARVEACDTNERLLVMVVDDDVMVREAVCDSLRDEGYEVVEATTGEGALRRLERTRRRKLLISDVDLGPGMNGLELAATVLELWPATGILLMSAEVLFSERNWECNFLAKPFSLETLLERVAATASVVP